MRIQGLVLTLIGLLFSLNSWAQTATFRTHNVEEGETVQSIAAKYGITPYDLIRLNPDIKGDVKFNDVLIIPEETFEEDAQDQVVETADFNTDKVVGDFIIHRVQKGETKWRISKTYGVSIEVLDKNNPELVDGLKTDMEIKIPLNPEQKQELVEQKKAIVSDSLNYKVHVIKARETIWRICYENGISRQELEELNPWINAHFNPGDSLFIPRTQEEKDLILAEQARMEAAKNKKKKRSDSSSSSKKKKKKKKGLFAKRQKNVEKEPEPKPEPEVEVLVSTEKGITAEKDAEEDSGKYRYYEVQPKDTMYGLSKELDLTQNEIFTLNPGLESMGLKVGMVLKLPRKITENPVQSEQWSSETITNLPTDSLMSEGEKLMALENMEVQQPVDMVVMLPFFLDKNEKTALKPAEGEKPELYRRSKIGLNFYQGMSLALDSLKASGVSVRVRIFDTENDPEKVDQIIRQNDFSETDVVLGPLYTQNAEKMAEAMKYEQGMVVSPFSTRHNLSNHENLVQVTPAPALLKTAVIHEIEDHYNGEMLTVVGSFEDYQEVNFIKNRLSGIVDSSKFNILLKKEEMVTREKLLAALDSTNNNIVVMTSANKALLSNVLSTVYHAKSGLQAKVFCIDPEVGSDLDDYPLHYLYYSGFTYPSYQEVDFQDPRVVGFYKNYQETYLADPERYALAGFDLTFDLAMRFSKYTRANEALLHGSTERIQSRYNFQKKSIGGYFNAGVKLVEFEKEEDLDEEFGL